MTLPGTIKKHVLDLLFPAACFGCGRQRVYFCEQCKVAVPVIPPSCVVCKKWVPGTKRVVAGRTCKLCRKNSHIYAFFSPFLYEHEVIRDLIHALKYQRVRGIASELSESLAAYIQRFGITFPGEVVVAAIPLHKKRERVRGFNQSALLAREFCNRTSLHFQDGVLLRNKYTNPQVGLSGDERSRNVLGSVCVENKEAVFGANILLIDDVKTTGATLEEAAKVLKQAGATRVFAMTVAH